MIGLWVGWADEGTAIRCSVLKGWSLVIGVFGVEIGRAQ